MKKKLTLLFCLLACVVSAQAQFEKGKWLLNPAVTGLGLSYDTGVDKRHRSAWTCRVVSS